jgi:endogenous inhibitor of DNA gyrase (YacG/DUF329 family)
MLERERDLERVPMESTRCRFLDLSQWGEVAGERKRDGG